MTTPPHAPAETPQNRFRPADFWTERFPLWKKIVADAALFLTLIGVLALAGFLLEKTPFPAERKQILQALHYYAQLVLLVLFAGDFVTIVMAAFFRRGR